MTDAQEERARKFDTEYSSLKETLDAIPFTATQRRDIDYSAGRMVYLFNEANGAY